MTFDDTAPDGGETAHGFNGFYNEDGFTLAATGVTQLFSFDKNYTPALNPDGTDYGGFQSNAQSITLTKNDGETFPLVSFKAAQIFGLPDAVILVEGEVFGGAMVQDAFETLATPFGSPVNWTTFTLPSTFLGVLSVKFTVASTNTTVIDDLVLHVVPTPATGITFIAGVLALCFLRKKAVSKTIEV